MRSPGIPASRLLASNATVTVRAFLRLILMRGPNGRSFSTLVDHLAIEDGHVDRSLFDRLGRNCEDVVGEHYQVCQLARFDGSFDRFLMFGESGSHGVGMNCLRNADALLGD